MNANITKNFRNLQAMTLLLIAILLPLSFAACVTKVLSIGGKLDEKLHDPRTSENVIGALRALGDAAFFSATFALVLAVILFFMIRRVKVGVAEGGKG